MKVLTIIALLIGTMLATPTWPADTPACVAVWYENPDEPSGVSVEYFHRSLVGRLRQDLPYVGVMVYLDSYGSGVYQGWWSGFERIAMRYSASTGGLQLTTFDSQPLQIQRKDYPGNLDDVEVVQKDTGKLFATYAAGAHANLESADWTDPNYETLQNTAYFSDPGTCIMP